MGFSFQGVKKGVYVDGHERKDVVDYRKVFLEEWTKASRRFVVFKEDGTWELPPGLLQGEKPLVLVTHDESTFNANDGKKEDVDGGWETTAAAKGKGERHYGVRLSDPWWHTHSTYGYSG